MDDERSVKAEGEARERTPEIERPLLPLSLSLASLSRVFVQLLGGNCIGRREAHRPRWRGAALLRLLSGSTRAAAFGSGARPARLDRRGSCHSGRHGSQAAVFF